MSDSYFDVLGGYAKTKNLEATLTRAFVYAEEQAHRFVTLDHLLLALSEDPDAAGVLEASGVDISRLRDEVAGFVGNIVDRLAPDDPDPPSVSDELLRIIETAAAASAQSKRNVIDGAVVLAALIGEGRSPAAELLRAHGLSFEAAIRTLQNRGPAARPATSQPQKPPPPPPRPAPAGPIAKREEAGSVPGRRPPPRSGPVDADDVLADLRKGPLAGAGATPRPRPAASAPPMLPPQSPMSAPNDAPRPSPAPRRGAPETSAEAPSRRPPPPSRPPAPRQPAPANGVRPESTRAPAGGRARGGEVQDGMLVENIPRRMTVAVPETVEVRIARRHIEALNEGMQGRGRAVEHEIYTTRAMSVRLRAPEGGMLVEALSPETQWIENTLGLLQDDFASWRFTVLPQQTGRARLQVVVSARSVGADGMTAETALPDRVIEVSVGVNYARALTKAAMWVGAILGSGAVGMLGERVFGFASRLLGG